MFADLHLHTNFSDGTYTPEELVAHGHRVGLGVLALTDHDTVEGCARMTAACAERGMEFIPAAELTTEHDGHELHVIGYFLDTEDAFLLKELARFQEGRQNRIREMCARLQALGVPLEAEAVFKLASCRAPGRPHVGRALVQAGLCTTLDESFDRYLKKGRPAWVPKTRMSAAEAMELIHGAGGLAVMAHPGLNRTDEVIPDFVAMGMDGIECFHSRHSTAASSHYLAIAEQYDLLITGGSDCHGMNKGKPLIGSIKLPYDYVAKMKEKVAHRRWAAVGK
jgi:predicted metal-dependent phosphoesterase TrpH